MRSWLAAFLLACGDAAPEATQTEAQPEPTRSESPRPEQTTTPAEAEAVAEATSGFDVKMVSPDELRALLTTPSGKPRLFNFWATWCGPCVAELPMLSRFQAEHPEVDVILVNVDMPKMRTTHVLPFLRKFELTNMRSVMLDDADPAGTLPKVVPDWPDSIPVTIVQKADGTRVRQYNGGVRAQDLEAALELAVR